MKTFEQNDLSDSELYHTSESSSVPLIGNKQFQNYNRKSIPFTEQNSEIKQQKKLIKADRESLLDGIIIPDLVKDEENYRKRKEPTYQDICSNLNEESLKYFSLQASTWGILKEESEGKNSQTDEMTERLISNNPRASGCTIV